MRQRLTQFMAGRYGVDQLSRFTLAVSIALLIAGQILGRLVNGIAGTAVNLLALVVLVYSYFRALSRNVYRRADENRKYLNATAGIRKSVRFKIERFRQRKAYKFYKCPSCRAMLRLPKGKGKIQITCRKCGNRFARKT